MNQKKSKKPMIITLVLVAAIYIGVFIAEQTMPATSMLFTVLKKGATYALVAVSMNLLNGFTGLFSLGQAGFMLLGAYTYAIFTVPMAAKDQVYYLYGGSSVKFSLSDMFAGLFGGGGTGEALALVCTVLCGLILAGLVAALFAALIGTPVLRLKSDYLAIATLGFAEILRAVFQWQTLGPVTNGANMIKSFPTFSDFNIKNADGQIVLRLSAFVPFLIAAICIVLIVLLIKSSYGRAFKSIRDDEIAAEAMGINLFKHKMMSFVTSSFFAGVGGALFAMYVSNAQAKVFTSAMTYEILLIVVIGGIGSVSGSVLGTFLYVACSEWWLRFLDNDTVLEGSSKSNFTVIFGIAVAALVALVLWRQNRKGKKFISSVDVRVGQQIKKKYSISWAQLFLLIVGAAVLVWDILFALGDQTKLPLLGSGFRMVVFSVVIMIIVLFFSRGIMGDKELPEVMKNLCKKIGSLFQKKAKQEGGQ